jgi:serine/threonine-protein kinase
MAQSGKVQLSEAESRLGRLAMERGWLTLEAFLEAVLTRDRKSPSAPLHEVLVKEGWLTAARAQELRALAESAPAAGPASSQEPLGRGPSGSVYRAELPGRKGALALKVIGRNSLNEPFIAAFAANARRAAILEHPGIARVVEVEERREALRIFSEFVDGEPLHDHVRSRGRLGLDAAAGLLSRAASALAAAHVRGVAHGNLKPENVFVMPGGRVKLTDAGLARAEPEWLRRHVDQAGTIVFSLAPERWHGPATASADLYSCGVLWYFMLTGRYPFTGATFAEIRKKHERGEAPSPSADAPGLPKSADALFARLVKKEPRERTASAGDLAAELDRLKRGERLEAEGSPTGRTKRRMAPGSTKTTRRTI